MGVDAVLRVTRMRSAMLKGLMVVLRGSENSLPLASMVSGPVFFRQA